MNISDILIKLLESTAWRMEAPEIGSAFHIFAVLAVSSAAVIAAVKISRMAEDTRVKILGALGWVMLAGELYKQFFYYFIVNGKTYDWWFFPFQLCSVPMYMCILLPFLSKQSQLRQAMVTFMCGFTFVSAAAALIWPEDMLRPYVTLTWHGIIWHGILLFISVMIGLSGMADLTWKGFLRSVVLFLVLCAIAIAINVLAEPIAAAHPIYPQPAAAADTAAGADGAAGARAGIISYPDMFYMSPYHSSTQPVISIIDATFGRGAAIAAYALMIIFAAGLTDFVFSLITQKNKSRDFS